jgi:hypothetical protein
MSLRYQVTDDVSPTVPLVTVTSSTNDCLVTMSSDVDADVIKVNIEENGEGEDKHAVALTAQGCAQRPKKRLVHKTGECNVSNINVQQRKRRFIVDIFHDNVGVEVAIQYARLHARFLQHLVVLRYSVVRILSIICIS